MSKRIIHALIACALGVALGLSVDCAQAANVPADESELYEQWHARFELCQQSLGNRDLCLMREAQTESQALGMAAYVVRTCKVARDEEVFAAWHCAASLTYIKQRWGY